MKQQFFLLIALYTILCTTCGNPTQNTDNKVFRYNEPTAVTSLDPAFARNQSNNWAVNQLFNSLVQLDDDLNIRPCIAKNWRISEDGLTYTFTLRTDVYFQDNDVFPNGKGRKVVAADAVHSFERILDPEVGSTGTWLLRGKLNETQPFDAPNDSTFVVQLSQPFRPMLGIFGMQYFSIVPKEATQKYGKAFRNHPVGTGPFKLVRWVENQTMILTKNEHYFETKDDEKLPKLDGVRINFISDRNTAFLEFMGKKLHFLSGLESSYVDEVLTKKGELKGKQTDRMKFFKTPFLNMEYLGIDMNFEENSPLQYKAVRQAMNYGFDRAKMLRELRNSVGQPAVSGFTPIGLPSYNAEKVKGYTYNPTKARQLLADAGFPNGDGLGEMKLYTTSSYVDLCTFIARQWEDLGIKVVIDLVESATLREMNKKGQSKFFRASWIMDYPDAENFLSLFYSKNIPAPNYTRFSNAEYDKLYELSLNENDDAKRFELYQSMERIIIEESPVIFLFYDETARFSLPNVTGLSTNASNLLTLKYADF